MTPASAIKSPLPRRRQRLRAHRLRRSISALLELSSNTRLPPSSANRLRQFSIPVVPSTSAPPPIPIGLPSQLLERRPDIAAAERNMAAANAQIGVAVAAYYPDLTLSASGGVESSAIGKLLKWPSRFWSIGPSISENDLRWRPSPRHRESIQGHLQCGPRRLSPDRTHGISAGGRLAGLSTHSVATNCARAAGSRLLRDLPATRTGALSGPASIPTSMSPSRKARSSPTGRLWPFSRCKQMTASVELIVSLGGGWDRSQLPGPAEVTQKPTRSETAIQH